MVSMMTDEEFEKEQLRRESEYDSISGYLEKQKRIKNKKVNVTKYTSTFDDNKITVNILEFTITK